MWCPYVLHPRCQVSSNIMLGLAGCELLSEFFFFLGFQNSKQYVHQITLDLYWSQTCYMAGRYRKLTMFSILIHVCFVSPHFKKDNLRNEAINFQALISHACFMNFFDLLPAIFPHSSSSPAQCYRAKRWYGMLCWKTYLISRVCTQSSVVFPSELHKRVALSSALRTWRLWSVQASKILSC